MQPFEITEVQIREYRRFNKRGTQWKVRLNPLPETSLPDPVIHFVDSVNSLFGLTVAMSWYPHYFNTRANLDYIGKIPDTIIRPYPSAINKLFVWRQRHFVKGNERGC